MTVYRLGEALAFPDPMQADPSGLLAFGGDLEPERVLLAYREGIFPWPVIDEPLLWFSPDPRMVLEPESLHVGRSLRKRLRRGEFEHRFDTDFAAVIDHCAAIPRPGEIGTWITPAIRAAYLRLYELGYAHSAESWRDGALVGGLYGVSLGACFFGESMFAVEADASKVAFVRLVEQLAEWKFALIDCQVHTEHLARFGASEWSRPRFLEALRVALDAPTRRGSWRIANPSS